MKIRITEQQAKRLKLINENLDMISQFEYLCKVNAQEMDKLYSKLIGLTVDEILNDNISFDEMETYVRDVEGKLIDANSKAYEYIKKLPDEDLDLRIDEAFDRANGKIAVIQFIIFQLRDLQNLSEEHNFPKEFANLKPINVSSN